MHRAAMALWLCGVLAACDRPAADPPPPAQPPAEATTAEIAARTPEALVRRLNARPHIPTDDDDIDTFFAADLAAAVKADQRPGDLGAIDYDYRWNAKDVEITDVRYEVVADGPGGSLIRVDYLNFGRPGSTAYALCRRADGEWRIADVAGGAGADAASLRAVLKLPKETNAC